jgi:multidrug efflux pump
MEEIKKDLPADIVLNVAMDNTRFIIASITEVQETLVIAFLLVVLIIFLFFRNWLIAIRPLIDIPVSLIGAFFIMYLAGFSINVLTMLAIVLATGLVVDDGIVVTENIYKKLEAGMGPREAAIKGSNEILFAVISTSLTLAVVFLPIIFLEGFVGRLFREFGIVISGAVLISAFVSLTLTPVLNVVLQKKDTTPSKFYTSTEPFFVGMNEAYRRSLEKFLKVRGWAWMIIVVSFVLIGLLLKNIPSEVAPMDDRNAMRVMATAPEGTSFEAMEDYMTSITNMALDSIEEKRIILTVVAPGFTGSGAVNTGFMRVMLKNPAERNKTQMQVAEQLQGRLMKFPDAKAFVIQEQTISAGGMRQGLPVQFILQNQDFEKIRNSLPQFMEAVSKDPTFQGVDANLKFNKPELDVIIDRDKAKSLGVSIADIAQVIQLSYSGVRYGYFNRMGKQYQIIGQMDRVNRDEPLDLSSLYVRNNAGALIQLGNIVQVNELTSPPQLFHYNRYKSATVSAGLAPGKTIGDGVKAMERIKDEVLDESFSTDLSGASRDFKESSSNTSFAFLLALLLIYLVLSAQFESFRDPLIIIVTVPLGIAGALITLWYFDLTINIFSQIGMIMLVGLVTKNGILIVEFANQQQREGKKKQDAVLIASVSRFRPILMTSMATILGAVPIAFALGAGATSRIPMGAVIIGGLLFSGFLTLYVVPAIYTFLSGQKKKKEHDETE